MTRWAAKLRYRKMPTDEIIWKSLRDKDLSKPIRAFLWKAMHNRYKLGRYWENIEGHKNRATCLWCGVTETLEHILIECKASGQETVWELTRCLFMKGGIDFAKPSLEDQLGCSLIKKDRKGNKGMRRFRKIIIAEAMYTIWCLRCKWRIMRESDSERPLTKEEILNRLKLVGR